LDLSSPQAVAAIVAGVVSILVGLITAVVTCYVMIVKFRLDNRTVFQAELAARELMMNSRWQWRTFEIIRHHLGGFKDKASDKFLFGQEQFERRLKMARKFGAFLIATKTFLA
jgi:hypothetical protein